VTSCTSLLHINRLKRAENHDYVINLEISSTVPAYFIFDLQVGDDLPLDSIYDALINRIPPPPNQATQPVSKLTVVCI